jgi:type VI secretion system protein ImpL
MAALKYIFAALLIAAVWATVLLLELPMWIAIVATVVIVLVLATYVIIKVVRAKKAAREIERALKAQADRHAQSARPDLRADIDAMQQEFLKAISALKSSKLGGKKPSEALYALPWYVIIGPPGSGKSTALRNSGLRFPYLSKSGGGVQGVGGTRNCQWWMTNDAVILDTAGRYTTEDSDRDEWLSFLELLKKNRPKQPVNGVMVAIAVTDVSEAHPEDVHTRAREIRSRIDEVMAKLEMVVPVYVLFTKIDLLPGFVELFGDLGNTERRQIWGFTLPVTVKQDPTQAFDQNFDELAQVIERRAVRRMGEERRVEARDKIYEFPQYFEPMKEKLALFVGELMADNVYAESPHLRGVYFTSGTQEGRTIDRIMNSMAAAFGIQPKLAYTTPQIEPKSYFLGELFEKVIFPDKLIAARSATKIKKQALIGHGIGAGLLLTAFGLAVLPVMGFRNNRTLLNDTNEAVTRIEEHHASNSSDPIRIEKLEPLRQVERELDMHEDEGTPFRLRMGMYQGERIYRHVRDLYLRTVRDELLRPILDIEMEQLNRFVQRYAPIQDEVKDSEHQEFEARLRFYLLLTCIPQVEGNCEYPPKGEPGLDEKQRPWLVETIADKWAKPLELAGDAATRSNMLAIAEAYIDIVATEPGYLFERNVRLVASVREILKRTDQTEALLAELTRDVEGRDIGLSDIVNLKTLKNDEKIVPRAYTRQAWDNQLRYTLSEPIENLLGNEWVLGLTAEEVAKNRENQLEELRSRYFEEYIRHWRGFLGSLHTTQPTESPEALAELRELTGGSSPPIVRLCSTRRRRPAARRSRRRAARRARPPPVRCRTLEKRRRSRRTRCTRAPMT